MLQYLSQREKEQLFHDSLHLLELSQTYVLIFPSHDSLSPDFLVDIILVKFNFSLLN